MVAAANRVMIELSRRSSAEPPADTNTISTNRISLNCESISISTSKSAFPIDIPFSGVISGESATMVMDLGAARKEVTLNGTIHEQEITKFKGGDATSCVRTLARSWFFVSSRGHSGGLVHNFSDRSNPLTCSQ